jgi:hypothetical protein
MKNLVTKRNVTILNLALLGIFLITLVAVGVTFFGDDPKPSLYAEEQLEVRAEAPPPVLEAEKSVYACPRHPEETSASPGKCSQCDTPLKAADRYASIVPRNLFFDPSLRPPKIVTPPPLPPLQLELVGVTKYPEGYVAIIRDKSKRIGRGFQEYIVREQQELPNHFGVTVASISPEPPVVKLDRAGVGVEELRMGEGTGSAATAQAQQWDEVVRPVRKDYTYLVKYKELQARNLNIEGYRGTFGLEPVTEGTRVTGLQITSLPRDNFLYAAGLKQGDVIETINGKAITGEDSAIEHLTNAAKGFSVQLGITRGRSKRTLIYTLLKN